MALGTLQCVLSNRGLDTIEKFAESLYTNGVVWKVGGNATNENGKKRVLRSARIVSEYGE